MNSAKVRNYPRLTPLLEAGNTNCTAETAIDATGPRIQMDPLLGEYYSFLDIDEAALRHRMLAEGLTDAQIAEHTVHVSNRQEDGYGVYFSKKKLIHLYPYCSYEEHDLTLQPGTNADQTYRWASRGISKEMSRVIYHELRHARQYVVEGNGSQRYKEYEDKLADRYKLAVKLGMVASTLAGCIIEVAATKSAKTHLFAAAAVVAGAASSVGIPALISKLNAYSDYANNPTEIEARAAEVDAPSNLFTCDLRQTTSVSKKTNGFVDTRDLLLDKGDELVRSELHPELWGDFLRVYADVSLGKHTTYLDIDAETVIQRLHEEGISEETMRELAIHFTADETTDLGEYMVDDKTIDIHTLGTLVQCMYRVMNDAKTNTTLFWDSHEADVYTTKTMAETLYHEIRHVAQYDRGDDVATANRTYNRALMGKRALRILIGTVASIGASTLLQKHFGSSLHNHVAAGVGGAVAGIINTIPTKSQKAVNYNNRPVELDAKNAEAAAPPTVLRVEMNTAPIVAAIQEQFGTSMVKSPAT